MKQTNILFALILGLTATNLLAQEPSRVKSRIQISPLAGVNLNKKIFIYGAELGYEYSISSNWSATGNMMYTTGSTNTPKKFSPINPTLQPNEQSMTDYSVNLGVKYYIGNFYISGGMGYGMQEQKLSFAGNNQDVKTSKNRFYQSLGVGYRIQLKNQNNLEIFMKSFGANDLNVVTGVRYSFGIGK